MTTRYAITAMFCALLVVSGCSLWTQEEDYTESPAISGEVDRDGESVHATLYQHIDDRFSANQSASGFIDTDDGTLLAYVELEFENLQSVRHDEPDEIVIGHLGSDIGHDAGITWYETRPDDSDDREVFTQGYRDGDGGSAEGTLFVDETDWTEYLRGRLEVEIDHPDHGKRTLDLEWNWSMPE